MIRTLFTLLTIAALATAAALGGAAATPPQKADHAKINAASLPPQVGDEQWAVLLCRFSDSPSAAPFPAASYADAFNTHAKSHKNYFRQASYGLLNISASVKNWRTIAARSTFSGSFQTRDEQFLFELYDACTQAHSATNFAGFEGIAMFFDDREKDLSDGTACQFGDTCTTDRSIGVSGYAYFDLDRGPLDGASGFRTIWMKTTSSALNEVTAHEMHHAYGAPHSAAGTDGVGDDPVSNECWDSGQFRDVCGHAWDLMASAWVGLPTDTHTLAATKVFHHKWISGARRCNVVTNMTDRQFELERLAQARANSRCLAITIKYSSGTDHFGTYAYWYVVEARFPNGFDADSDPFFLGGGVPGAAVIVSRVCVGTSPFCSPEPVVLGRDANHDFSIDETSAEWQPGESFVNFDRKVRVEVVSRGFGFYTVKVSRNTNGGL